MSPRFFCTFLVLVCGWSAAAAADYYRSYEECQAAYDAKKEEANRWDTAWSDCVAGSRGGSVQNCRGMDSNQKSALQRNLASRRDAANQQARMIWQACQQVKAQEREQNRQATDRARQERERQEQAARQRSYSTEQYQRNLANEQRQLRYSSSSPAEQRAQRKAAEGQAQAAAVGALLGALLNRDRDDDDEDDDRYSRYDEPNVPQRDYAAEAAAAEAARAAEAERQRNEQENQQYYEMLSQLTQVHGNISTATSLMENPFTAAADMASNALTEKVLASVAESTIPGSTPSDNPRLAAAADVVQTAQTIAMGGNPFVGAIAGQSLGGVSAVQQRSLGQLENVTQTIADIESNPRSGQHGDGSAARMLRQTGRSGSGNGNATPRFYDVRTATFHEVPEGHVLYRAGSNEGVTVVRADAMPTAGGDIQRGGKLECSASGVGVVLPACEANRNRARNPFHK